MKGRRESPDAADRRARGRSLAASRGRWIAVAGTAAVVLVLAYGLAQRSGRSRPHGEAGGGGSRAGSATLDVPRVDDLTALDPAVASAIRDAVAAVEREPSSGTRWGELGIVYNAHRYYALADRCYARATELDRAPDWPHLRGVLAQERGDVEVALSSYRAALERSPDDSAARYRLGTVLLESGRVDDAEREFTQLASTAATESWGALGLGRVALRRHANADAARHFERALALDSANDQAAYLLASAYRELGNTAEARRLADRARDGVRPSMPPDPYVDRVRAGLRSLQSQVAAAGRAAAAGDDRTAAAIYSSVLEIDPTNYDALYQLALLNGRQQRFADAQGLLERAIAARPKSTEARLMLGFALVSLNRLEQAAEQLRALLEIDPDDDMARGLLQSIEAERAK